MRNCVLLVTVSMFGVSQEYSSSPLYNMLLPQERARPQEPARHPGPWGTGYSTGRPIVPWGTGYSNGRPIVPWGTGYSTGRPIVPWGTGYSKLPEVPRPPTPPERVYRPNYLYQYPRYGVYDYVGPEAVQPNCQTVMRSQMVRSTKVNVQTVTEEISETQCKSALEEVCRRVTVDYNQELENRNCSTDLGEKCQITLRPVEKEKCETVYADPCDKYPTNAGCSDKWEQVCEEKGGDYHNCKWVPGKCKPAPCNKIPKQECFQQTVLEPHRKCTKTSNPSCKEEKEQKPEYKCKEEMVVRCDLVPRKVFRQKAVPVPIVQEVQVPKIECINA